MKVRMSDSREISGYGLKQNGEVWDAPIDLAEQLIRQGVAVEALDEANNNKGPTPTKSKARVG